MTPRTLRLGHSPDSDDAFMFYALAAGKLDTGGLRFEHILRDIETLNSWATEGELEITALSAHAYAYVSDRYLVLPHGASMGEGYGPMVVTRENSPLSALRGATIAVPGKLTSAYLALRLYEPSFNPVFMPFDTIMDAVRDGTVDAGLLIHEGQLTHGKLGLHTVVDLGKWWNQETGLPLPLGLNAVRRDLGAELIAEVNRLLHESIQYALNHREDALSHAMAYSRGLDRGTADRFVGMYVNSRTLDMGPDGREAVRLFLKRGADAGIVPHTANVEFTA